MRDLKELKLWLEGTEPTQVNWRLNPDNLAQVSQMIDDLAATVGGVSASVTWARVTAEKKKAASSQAAIEKEKVKREALLEAIREDYIAGGGTESSFKANRSKIVEQYALSGRSVDLVEKSIANRRNKAARTF